MALGALFFPVACVVVVVVVVVVVGVLVLLGETGYKLRKRL